MKVAILSYETFNNVGETLLGESTEFLVKKQQNIDVERFQLVPSYKEVCRGNAFAALAMPLQFIALKLEKIGIILHKLWILVYWIRLYSYYNHIVKNCDKIILAVGMLKFKNQNFSYIYEVLCHLATKYDKKVLFNAMSIAKPDISDKRYHQLLRAINQPCVFGISTRDGEEGLSRLRQSYIRRNNVIIEEVGDPALWISDIYPRTSSAYKADIGVNLITPNIYTNYGNESFTSEQMKNLYAEIIEELDTRGYSWRLFTNGMSCDFEFGKQLLMELKLPADKLEKCPHSINEFVHQLTSFKAIFGARLHADISSVSYRIPLTGLLWDEKLKYFGETMGIHNFFTGARLLSGKVVVDKLEIAMITAYDDVIIEEAKKRTENFINLFLDC